MTTASPDRDVSRYKIDGLRVPSVTEILAIAGLVDFSGVDAETLQAAQERGRWAHRVTALWDRGELGEGEELPDDFRRVGGYLEAYANFRSETGWKPLRVEYPFVHARFRYAGTIDRVFAKHGVTAVVDLKTGSAIPDWVGLQLSGYRLGVRTEFDEMTRWQRFALRLLPDGHYRLVECKDVADELDFLAALRVAHRKLRTQHITLEDR